MLEKLKAHLKDASFTTPRGDTPEFTIAHYAGDVTYQVDGFLDKNRDTLAVDLVAVMRLSDISMIAELFGGGSGKGNKSKRSRAASKKALRKSVKNVRREMNKANKQTLATIFKGSLASLMYVGVLHDNDMTKH